MSGLDPSLPRTVDSLVRGFIDRGTALGAQAFVAHRGRTVLDEAWGTTHDGRPVTVSTRFPVFSACKPVTATAFHIAAQRGLVAYRDPVAKVIPEFAQHGKDEVTWHHVLLHRAGVSDSSLQLIRAETFADWDAGIAAICAMPPESAPGAVVMYHPLTGSALLAEAVRRTDGRSFVDFCRDEIFAPLGMQRATWGLPAGLEAEATLAVAGAPEHEDLFRRFNSPQGLNAVLPGAGLYCRARDLGRFYRAWCSDGGGVVSPETVRLATTMHDRLGDRSGTGYGFHVGAERKDPTFRRGNLASERSFGHNGYANSTAWCDPETQVSAVFLFNLAPSEAGDRRFNLLSDAVHRAVRA
ncbi:MAG TPA: serine hydrolase domain-containing protein [Actinomycetota bacterium]|nr:serine hydrolase domain-containing protein [Actinomycetota bacterium]